MSIQLIAFEKITCEKALPEYMLDRLQLLRESIIDLTPLCKTPESSLKVENYFR